MFRALTILAAVVALAVSASPASAHNQPFDDGAGPASTKKVGVQDFHVTKWAKAATPRTLGAGKDRGWVKAPPRSPAIHENEGIDGGFKTKSRLKATPKPRVVTNNSDPEKLVIDLGDVLYAVGNHTRGTVSVMLLHGDFATFGRGKAKAPRSASAFTSQTGPHADGLSVAKNRTSMSMGKPMVEW